MVFTDLQEAIDQVFRDKWWGFRKSDGREWFVKIL